MDLSVHANLDCNCCRPAQCHAACGLEIVDHLLRAADSVRGQEVDWLLDLRSLLRGRTDAEATLGVFCQLRRELEERHYLEFYRLRRWLENHVQVRVRISRILPERFTPLKLDNYCLEAVRCRCLRAALAGGETPVLPRVRFQFRPVAVPVEMDGASVSSSARSARMTNIAA